VRYLLNTLYLLLLVAASPWLLWQAFRTGKYREGYAETLLGRVPTRTDDRRCIWLHAVSVGEVNLLRQVIEMLARDDPESTFVVSTTTRSGMKLARERYPDLDVFYCPLDFSWAVGRAMSRIRPDVLVLAELELWPNLIGAAKRNGAKVAVINGRLSETSFRGYRRLGRLVRPVLKKLDLVAVQNGTYAERFVVLGAQPNRTHVTGSLKFDGARSDRANSDTLRLAKLAGIAGRDVIFLAGSTQDPEERYALKTFEQLAGTYPNLRLILVPRHPERFDEVARLLDASGLPWQRRSELQEGETATPTGILLVDTVGELGAWWGTARLAFVGGSLDNRRGGQNMIEPAAYGAAVCFGPNTQNFRDVVTALLEHDGAKVIENPAALADFVRWCLDHPAEAAAMGQRAREFVASQSGATRTTCDLLRSLIEGQSQIRPAA